MKDTTKKQVKNLNNYINNNVRFIDVYRHNKDKLLANRLYR